jgi:hypothetical protein
MKRSLLGIVAASALVVVGCLDSNSSSPTAAPAGTEAAATTAAATTEGSATTAGGASTSAASGGGTASNIQKPGECGMGTGQKATGEPIKLGAMATKSPQADFTWITSLTKSSRSAARQTSGDNGRPIDYITYEGRPTRSRSPASPRSSSRQDKVLGIVRAPASSRCSVNRTTAQQNMYLIIAGVAQDCFEPEPRPSTWVRTTPAWRRAGCGAEPGPRGKRSSSRSAPGFDIVNSGVVDFAKQQGLEGKSILEDVPFTDPAGLARRLVRRPATVAASSSTSPARS